jgi:nucleoside-diphosphate-sugar epimerase
MKVAITGHTKGIGYGLYNFLSPTVKGFSRTNGYDINSFDDRRKIISESADCDIFINNAHFNFGQIYMLLDLFREWKNLDKTIINIGSQVTEINLEANRHDLLNYQAEKLILKQMSAKLQGYKCKVVYRSFGYVGTDTIKLKYPNFKNNDYISVEEAIKIILS